MANRPRPTLADYMVIAISPALIMALVGSLVFFLLELLYQGQYGTRMQYVFALFVFASVLIGRISIEEGRERALGFSLALAVAVLLVLNKFVDYSGFFARLSLVINIGLIVVILWCSNKLTWDCTVIDEQEDASGEGLLQTMGMDEEAESGTPPDLDLEATSGSKAAEPKSEPTSLWQRFVEARRKKHAPGVWVVYFSMAALPIFGIGQGFIFGQDLADRRFVFKLLVVYVAAALGLLVTTSFLGLRRYLRQRRLEMPPQMAGVWLGVGSVMIVALLLFCMLLPRRNAEYSVTHLPAFAQAPTDLQPNRWGFGNDGPEDENAKRQVKRDEAKTQTDQTGGKQDGGKQDGSKQDGGKQDGGKQDGGKQDGGKQDGGKQDGGKQDGGKQEGGKQEGGKQDGGKQEGGKQDGGKQEDQSRSGEQDPSKGKQDENGRNKSKEQSESQKQRERESSGEERKSREQEQSESNQQQDDNRAKKQTAKSKSRSKFDPAKLAKQIGGGIGVLLKLLYWLIAILIVGWFVWRYWEQVLEAVRSFIKAMKEFWARLFGGTVDEAEEVATEAIDTGPPPRPFSDFPNPFQTDLHARLSLDQLVAYSFEAFEAWARERGYGRDPEQTPHEFAAIVGQAAAPLSQDAIRLADLYNRSAYSDGSLPAASLDYVRRFWSQLAVS